MIIELLLFAIVMLAVYGLFIVGQTGSKTLFYLLLFSPVVIIFLLNALLYNISHLVVSIFGTWGLILFIFTVLERIIWGVTLRETSGEDKLVWFYLIYFVPMFWLLYRVVKLR